MGARTGFLRGTTGTTASNLMGSANPTGHGPNCASRFTSSASCGWTWAAILNLDRTGKYAFLLIHGLALEEFFKSSQSKLQSFDLVVKRSILA